MTLRIIGRTNGSSTAFESEFNVMGEQAVKMGEFVKVEIKEPGSDIEFPLLCKVVDLRYKRVGGKNGDDVYVGKISPVILYLRPIPPNTSIYPADISLIQETLGIFGGEGQFTIGNLLGTDIPVNLHPRILMKHLAVLGMTSSGKTYAVTQIVEQLTLMGITTICVDPHNDFSALAETPELDGKVHIIEDEFDGFFKLDDIYHEGKCTVIPLNNSGYDACVKGWIVDNVVEVLFGAAKEERTKPFVLIIDECHEFVPEKTNSEAKAKIIKAIREGRKFGMGMILLTQRPAAMSKMALSQCNTQLVMHVTNGNDITAIANNVEGIGREDKQALRKLDVGEGLLSGGNLKTTLYVKIAKRITKDREQNMIGVGGD